MSLCRFSTALIVLLAACNAFAGASEDFATLLADEWEARLARYPVFASELGDKRYNDQWEDLRLAAVREYQDKSREFLRRTYAIDKAALNDADQLNFELFRRTLQNRVDRFQFNAHLLPLHHRGGAQNLEETASGLSFESVPDYEDWLARMNKIDTYIEQTIALAEAGRQQGYMPPRILMQRIPDQIAAQLVDSAEDSPFFAVFEDLPDSINSSEQSRLRAAARKSIEDVVLPAYRQLDRYFRETYLPASRDSIGLSELPNGSAWYEQRTRHYTTTNMSPDDVHALGLSEVKRIRDEMQKIIDELDFDGGFNDFLVFLRTDPQFYFDNPDDLYAAYLATSKRIDPELVKQFGMLPRMPYGVKPIPETMAPDTTTAYYTAPAADGSRAGIYWVNLYRPDVRPKYEIEVLSVHEAMPGHHLQIALQQELGDMPEFRRFGGFTAFIEGWGLYSESLGYDLGLYQDPYSRFGQLTYEMWRAVRLVVDTGIHYKGWTRQQAIDFFKANAAKTELDIINEIDRYIGNPGQALAYKIGQLRMQTIRLRAEAALGDRFDVRAFHDELLGAGALPLDLLEQRMDAWISSVESD
jgi:prolyl oligopeptidase